MLPPLPLLEIHDPQEAKKRKWFNSRKCANAVQVATLLTVIGEEARQVFSTFSVGPRWRWRQDRAGPSQVQDISSHNTDAHKGHTTSTGRRCTRERRTVTIAPDEIHRDRLMSESRRRGWERAISTSRKLTRSAKRPRHCLCK